MAQWPKSAPVEFHRSIYLAEATTLLDELRNATDDAAAVMLVGHNPGLAELAHALVARGEPRARIRMMDGFPTCSLAILDFEIDHWHELSTYGGHLVDFVTLRAGS